MPHGLGSNLRFGQAQEPGDVAGGVEPHDPHNVRNSVCMSPRWNCLTSSSSHPTRQREWGELLGLQAPTSPNNPHAASLVCSPLQVSGGSQRNRRAPKAECKEWCGGKSDTRSRRGSRDPLVGKGRDCMTLQAGREEQWWMSAGFSLYCQPSASSAAPHRLHQFSRPRAWRASSRRCWCPSWPGSPSTRPLDR